MSPTAGHTHSYGGSFRVTPRTCERPVLTGQSRIATGSFNGGRSQFMFNHCSNFRIAGHWREILEILWFRESERERERERERPNLPWSGGGLK